MGVVRPLWPRLAVGLAFRVWRLRFAFFSAPCPLSLRARSLLVRFGCLLPGLFWGWLMSSSVSGFVPFVPSASAVSLGRSGFASSVVPVRGLGFSGGVVSRASWVSGSSAAPAFLPSSVGASALWVWFAGSSAPLVCLVGAFGGVSGCAPLVSAVASALSSGEAVFPVVAAGPSGVAASGFFCGLAAVGPGSSAAPAVGSFAL